MSYTKTGKPRGRPRTHTLETGPVKFSLRCPRPLYQSLEAAAKAQGATITTTALRALEQALGIPQHHGASVDLAAVETGLLAMGEAVAALEARCNCCEQCRTHITATIDAAWPKLVAAFNAMHILPTVPEGSES